MRLINTRTLKLELFYSYDLPKYAVLSHTWGAEEVTFTQLMDGSGPDQVGFGKVTAVCQLALENHLEYVWIDTCCIDRSSGSELNKSITSMYDWFEDAEVCYAYLAHVETDYDIRRSPWFTRSWTLLELLAPQKVEFYSRHWEPLGTKITLANTIAEITGIATDILRHERHPKSAPVAERMSWASKRSTNRIEDGAYSLIGLFNIRMALDYGEGLAAFLRLWEEILKNLEDYTVLLWTKPLGGDEEPSHLWNPLVPDPTIVSRNDTSITENLNKPNWNELRLHSPLDLESTESFAFCLPPIEKEPQGPQFTSRGLRMSLFSKAVGPHLIAWTYCTQERNGSTYAVCVRVIPINTGNLIERKYLRGVVTGEVCHVSVDRLRGFELKDIYFSLRTERDLRDMHRAKEV
jgi:hypothetical protein